MLKKCDLAYLNKLRIIELFELDLNTFLKFIMGRRYPKYEKANNLSHPESYGAMKGRSAHGALNSVQLALEQSWIMRSPMVMAPKDATGCFDLIHLELIKLIQDSKGVPTAMTSAKPLITKNMKRLVQTGNGLSKTSFQWTPENNNGGIGQGNGKGPQACNDQMGLLKTIHARESNSLTITHPSGELRFVIHGPGLIDDQIDLISLPSNSLA